MPWRTTLMSRYAPSMHGFNQVNFGPFPRVAIPTEVSRDCEFSTLTFRNRDADENRLRSNGMYETTKTTAVGTQPQATVSEKEIRMIQP